MDHDEHHNHRHSSHSSNEEISDLYKILKSGKGISGHHDEHSDMPVESFRQFTHNGHNVSIKTTYEIKIDDELLGGHLYVDDFGNVSCHTFPTYSFHSMTDFIKNLIDEYPESFQQQEKVKNDCN